MHQANQQRPPAKSMRVRMMASLVRNGGLIADIKRLWPDLAASDSVRVWTL